MLFNSPKSNLVPNSSQTKQNKQKNSEVLNSVKLLFFFFPVTNCPHVCVSWLWITMALNPSIKGSFYYSCSFQNLSCQRPFYWNPKIAGLPWDPICPLRNPIKCKPSSRNLAESHTSSLYVFLNILKFLLTCSFLLRILIGYSNTSLLCPLTATALSYLIPDPWPSLLCILWKIRVWSTIPIIFLIWENFTMVYPSWYITKKLSFLDNQFPI